MTEKDHKSVVANLEKQIRERDATIAGLTAEIVQLKGGPPAPLPLAPSAVVDRWYVCSKCSPTLIAAGNAHEQQSQREYIERAVPTQNWRQHPHQGRQSLIVSPPRPTTSMTAKVGISSTCHYMDSVYHSLRLNR